MKNMDMTAFIAAALVVAVTACGRNREESLRTMIDRCYDTALSQSMMLAESTSPLEGMLPRTFEDGELKTTDYRGWVCGFFPGTLWELYEHYPDNARLRGYAEEFTARVFPAKDMTSTHDLGFMVFCSSGNAWRLTGDTKYRDVILAASQSLATRYNEKTGVIMSWNPNKVWKYPVIIDNMMNLEMLMWAGRETGDSSLVNIALSHAETTLRNHFREDGSSWHVVSYNPETGDVELRQTHQGYSDRSMWARGQSWAIYGYTMVYRETRDPRFLAFAQKVTDIYLKRLPERSDDWVPLWDFDDPSPSAPKDASAACVVASALLELSGYVSPEKGTQYREAAEQMLASLGKSYQSGDRCVSFLLHSTGHHPAGSEIDASIVYADYYYYEALLRLRRLQQGCPVLGNG